MANYTENNSAAITDYAECSDNSEIISTAFAKSIGDLVFSRRFAKKQQMQLSGKGTDLLLQTQTRTLGGTLHDLFTTWYRPCLRTMFSLYPSLRQSELPLTVPVGLSACG